MNKQHRLHATIGWLLTSALAYSTTLSPFNGDASAWGDIDETVETVLAPAVAIKPAKKTTRPVALEPKQTIKVQISPKPVVSAPKEQKTPQIRKVSTVKSVPAPTKKSEGLTNYSFVDKAKKFAPDLTHIKESHPLTLTQEVIKGAGRVLDAATSQHSIASMYNRKANQLATKAITTIGMEVAKRNGLSEEDIQSPMVQMALQHPMVQNGLDKVGKLIAHYPAEILAKTVVTHGGKAILGEENWSGLITSTTKKDGSNPYFTSEGEFSLRKFLSNNKSVFLAAVLKSDLAQDLVAKALNKTEIDDRVSVKLTMQRAGQGLELYAATKSMYRSMRSLHYLLNADADQVHKPITNLVTLSKQMLTSLLIITEMKNESHETIKMRLEQGAAYKEIIDEDSMQGTLKKLLDSKLFQLTTSQLMLIDSVLVMTHAGYKAEKGTKLMAALQASPDVLREAVDSILPDRIQEKYGLMRLIHTVTDATRSLIQNPAYVDILQEGPGLVKKLIRNESLTSDEMEKGLDLLSKTMLGNNGIASLMGINPLLLEQAINMKRDKTL